MSAFLVHCDSVQQSVFVTVYIDRFDEYPKNSQLLIFDESNRNFPQNISYF